MRKRTLSILCCLAVLVSSLSGLTILVHAESTATPLSATKTETEKIVIVGDSITEGVVFPNVSNWDTAILPNRYTTQLGTMLNEASETTNYQIVNCGISGSAVIGKNITIPNSSDIFGGAPTHWMDEQIKRGGYIQSADKLLIMLGTNDAATGTWETRVNYYVEFYKKIIDAFRAENPQVEIYVVTSPYTSVSTHYMNLENYVVPTQKKMAAALGLPCIDVYGASKHFVEVENNGNLGAFIDAVDMTKGSRLHPHEAGHTVIAETIFQALTGDPNDLYLMSADGAQLRDYQGGVPEGDDELSIRFATTLPVHNVTADANGNTIISNDSRITIGGRNYTVVGMGSVIAIADKIGNPVIELVANQEDGYAKTVSAAKLYATGEGTVTFTGVVTGITAATLEKDLVCRGYVKYIDGGKTTYAYGPVMTRNAAQVLVSHTVATVNPTYDTWNMAMSA